MSQQQVVIKLFEFAILVFALSLHEAAHAWMASKLGDPTARMLGRLTLNPLKHIDPFGTILIPLAMLFLPFFGDFLIGWAKPTPVTPNNFKHLRRDDILTTLAGPVSNLLGAVAATALLIVLARLSPAAATVVRDLATGMRPDLSGASPAVPIALLLYLSIWLNLILAVFNLIPLPPLDGSHILRHFLPYKALRLYDSIGIIGLLIFLFLGGRLLGMFVDPMLGFVNAILMNLAI